MRILGDWHECKDGVMRPIVRGEVRAADGSWMQADFLLDTGADRAVLHADLVSVLGLGPVATEDRLAGPGGPVDSIVVETEIRMARDRGSHALFRGQFAAATDPRFLDMSVLGREVLGLFAVIVDRPGDLVCLIRPPSRHRIEPA